MPVIDMQGQPWEDDNGGEPPDNGGMEARVAKLEAVSQQLLTDVAVMRSNYATKEDIARVEGGLLAKIAEAKNSIIMWVVSAILLAQLLPALLKKFGL
jgi:hypothetical protein